MYVLIVKIIYPVEFKTLINYVKQHIKEKSIPNLFK